MLGSLENQGLHTQLYHFRDKSRAPCHWRHCEVNLGIRPWEPTCTCVTGRAESIKQKKNCHSDSTSASWCPAPPSSAPLGFSSGHVFMIQLVNVAPAPSRPAVALSRTRATREQSEPDLRTCPAMSPPPTTHHAPATALLFLMLLMAASLHTPYVSVFCHISGTGVSGV